MAPIERIYRLGLAGFSDAQARGLTSAVARLDDVAAHWRIVEDLPFDALLLARGSRPGDPDDTAVLRVLAAPPAPPDEPETDRRRSPLLLRRPIADDALRAALRAARERLRSAA